MTWRLQPTCWRVRLWIVLEVYQIWKEIANKKDKLQIVSIGPCARQTSQHTAHVPGCSGLAADQLEFSRGADRQVWFCSFCKALEKHKEVTPRHFWEILGPVCQWRLTLMTWKVTNTYKRQAARLWYLSKNTRNLEMGEIHTLYYNWPWKLRWWAPVTTLILMPRNQKQDIIWLDLNKSNNKSFRSPNGSLKFRAPAVFTRNGSMSGAANLEASSQQLGEES